MAYCNAINTSRIELLTRDNYDTWRIQAEAIFIKNETWSIVAGTNKKPEIPETQDKAEKAAAKQKIDEWIYKDSKARADLILCISPSELKPIKECKTSHEIWAKLENTYASRGPARKAGLFKQLSQQKMAEGDDIKKHLDSFFDAVDKLRAMDISLDNDLLSIMLLYSLPSSYENFRCAIESRDELPNPENLKIKITEEHASRQQGKADYAMFIKTNRFNKQKSGAKPKPTYKCNFCGIKGHKEADCRKKKKQEAERSKSTQNDGNSSYTCFHSAGNQTTASSDRWCLDSGCTTHLCGNEKAFDNLTQIDSKLQLADNNTTPVHGKGNVHIKTDKYKTIRLSDTLYVPDLRTNLVSIAKIVDNDLDVTFKRSEAVITDRSGEIKVKAKRIGNLFYLEEHPKSFSAAEISHDSSNSVDTWHSRLGHINAKDFKTMLKRNSVTGINVKGPIVPKDCKTCLIAKFTATPFPKRESRSQEKLELIYTDVCGPMRTTARGGGRYFITFIDDYTRYCTVYIIKEKSEAVQKFMEFKNLVETQTGLKIKALQSDGGREYCNTELDVFCKEAGIQRRLTVHHTPEQNGVAERKNRSLVETAKCLLTQSGLPDSFWGEAINTANYIRNRSITAAIPEFITPYEKWYGNKPHLEHLHTFGEQVVFLDKSPTKGKLDARGIPGIFVGYSKESKAYRIYVPEQGKIMESRDVKFLNTFASISQQKHENESSSEKASNPKEGYNTRSKSKEHIPFTEVNLERPSPESTAYPSDNSTVTREEAINDADENSDQEPPFYGFENSAGLDDSDVEPPFQGFPDNNQPAVNFLQEYHVAMNATEVPLNSTYLNGDLDSTTYKKQPEMLIDSIKSVIENEKDPVVLAKAKAMLEELKLGDKVCKLQKSLYGLRQSDRQWNIKLDETLRSIGFKPTQSDPCFYVDSKDSHTYILVYVDDGFEEPTKGQRDKTGSLEHI